MNPKLRRTAPVLVRVLATFPLAAQVVVVVVVVVEWVLREGETHCPDPCV